MTDSTRRPERTITVETQALGPIRVRRISLGGMARIAERMRAQGSHDETALGEALVAEVVVAGLESEGTTGAGGSTTGAGEAMTGAGEAPGARLARLSDEDRRSIAAAVLTLEGVKGAGDDVLEDPRATLARRYSHVLETQRHHGPRRRAEDAEAGEPDPAPLRADEARGGAQIALFEDLQAPPAAAAAGPRTGDPARPAPAARAPAAWDRERASLQADIADLEALLAGQAELREGLESSVASAGEQVRTAQRVARRQRWLAAAALALLVVVAGAQFIWIGVLRRDVAEQRAQFEARLQAQQQALDEAQRAAAQANARAERLAASRTPAAKPAPATKSASTRRSAPAKSPPARTSGNAAATKR